MESLTELPSHPYLHPRIVLRRFNPRKFLAMEGCFEGPEPLVD